MQDADAILADCQDLVRKHGLDRDTTRPAIQAMLDEQPAPLRGASSKTVILRWPRSEFRRTPGQRAGMASSGLVQKS